MIDLHTHTLFSDGELLPSELLRRAEVLGLRAVALADHADMSTLDHVVPRIVRACEENNRHRRIRAIPAIELTHVPPALIGRYVEEARRLGARIVVVHGESPVEPVEPGTNRAAIEAGADILSHPGLIADEEARMAAERGVSLEVSARKGHSLANGHVVAVARRTGARLVLNTDAHAPADLIAEPFARTVALGAGMTPAEYEELRSNMARLAGWEAPSGPCGPETRT
ncbi:MAG: histidinol phosphate phosphatase domain-containing protein [Deltaproteobacteria bacterium]|nr:histidinol phosphate phosphatase domain-containing protein [Deltaproteobacteria bacterium]